MERVQFSLQTEDPDGGTGHELAAPWMEGGQEGLGALASSLL